MTLFPQFFQPALWGFIMLPRIWKLIDEHANKRSFMRAVAEIWGHRSFEYLMIKIAYDMMFTGHRKDRRTDGVRYTRHTVAVAVIILLYLEMYDHEVVIAALLHDLHEDHPNSYPLQVIEETFGPRVACIVCGVTKPPYELYGGKTEAHANAASKKVIDAGIDAVIVKLADRVHNCLTLWGSPDKKRAKVMETMSHYLPMAWEHQFLYYEIFVALSHQFLSPALYKHGSSEIGRQSDDQTTKRRVRK